MARAALRLASSGAERDDLRVAIVSALLELYGPDVTSERVAELTAAILPIEAAELDPRACGRVPRDRGDDGGLSKRG
jgi:hypothetical protein